MIRLIQRRLIIPRGDTGEFTIPTAGAVEQGDIAIFAIYDPLLQKTVCQKEILATNETLKFVFEQADTANLEPSDRYEWDIKIYHGPQYDTDNNLIGGTSVDSYYAAFGTKMPKCVIKQVAMNV